MTTTWNAPLRRRSFSYLMGSQFIGLLGDQLFPLAMVGTALAREGETALTLGAVFAARFLGSVCVWCSAAWSRIVSTGIAS